jgi:hypothetical protein
VRNPYIVGRWVQGRNHYGRQRLISHLLTSQDSATWVVGTRRMGKTSLLRQLEFLCDKPDSAYVPLYWDMQGCSTTNELSEELHYSLDLAGARFRPYDIDPGWFINADAVFVLRQLGRRLAEYNKRLLLLVDEAEVLIEIARKEPAWLGRLRKVLQEGRLRTVITSTKLLTRLNSASAAWETSPFLFGFNLANLWTLEHEAAVTLIRQGQAEQAVRADDARVNEIMVHTNCHPYLIQYVCYRLFENDEHGEGYLRAIVEDDLHPDHILAAFFEIDYEYLTRIERRLLLAIAERTVATEEEVLIALSDELPQRIQMYLYGLHRLGYVRQIQARWSVGNEYLRRWIQENFDDLARRKEAMIDEASHELLLQRGRDQELAYLREQIEQLLRELASLQAQRRKARAKQRKELAAAIQRLETDLAEMRAELERLASQSIVQPLPTQEQKLPDGSREDKSKPKNSQPNAKQ